MSYQVLARKYRPQTFDEVVGQEAVVATLKNAIASNRLHHAYLFAGARGIGKTSLARIFAKAINCEKGPTAAPCNQCSLCKEITEGTSLDVHEIDGASNTSVEDVRELREGLKYLPAAARKKIYIIDEVHMLSGSAFNALLKTLEEPPPHVLFFFATTEVHKIPATILSRCQRFDLRRIPSEQLLAQLTKICEREKIKPDTDALLMIGREAEGSLRDAQSLLDQAIAYSGGNLNAALVSSMLGLVNTSHVHQITEAVLNGETQKALQTAQEIYEKGHDLKQFAIQWLTHWRHLFIYRTTGSDKALPDLTETERTEVRKKADQASVTVLDIGFHYLHRGVEEIARSEFPKILLDVLVVRLSNASELKGLQQILEQLQNPNALSAPTAPAAAARPNPSPVSEAKESVSRPSSPVQSPAASPAGGSLKAFIQHVMSKRPQVGSLLGHVKASGRLDDVLLLQLEPGGIWFDMLKDRQAQLEEMAQEFFGKKMRVVIQDTPLPEGQGEVMEMAASKKGSDPIVNSALNILNARIEEVN
ncbi:MAG: DNA polymerase III subunit gamma/tau [bacterium]